jgi:hypothetical protein
VRSNNDTESSPTVSNGYEKKAVGGMTKKARGRGLLERNTAGEGKGKGGETRKLVKKTEIKPEERNAFTTLRR